MKKLLTIIAALVAATSVYALSDGRYFCAATKIVEGDYTYKLSANEIRKKGLTLTLKLKNNEYIVDDSGAKFKYSVSTGGIDFYKNSKVNYSVGLGENLDEDNYTSFGIVFDNSDRMIIGGCKYLGK